MTSLSFAVGIVAVCLAGVVLLALARKVQRLESKLCILEDIIRIDSLIRKAREEK